jgi:hypothetical protein
VNTSSRSHRKIQNRTKFLLQVLKQQEDSAILLASNRPQHNDKTKNRSTEMEKQNFKGKDSRGKTSSSKLDPTTRRWVP